MKLTDAMLAAGLVVVLGSSFHAEAATRNCSAELTKCHDGCKAKRFTNNCPTRCADAHTQCTKGAGAR